MLLVMQILHLQLMQYNLSLLAGNIDDGIIKMYGVAKS
jgi:hypothetical protein